MIGVLCKDCEKDVAREFFELFKTPWEFFIEGRYYDVLISTIDEIPELNSGLFILYSSNPTRFDVLKGIALGSRAPGRFNDQKGINLPIYGCVAKFCGQGQPLLYDKSGSEAVAVKLTELGGQNLRLGYDLFYEVAFLLSEGQPTKNALSPTLELHIALLREWILDAGIPLVEIPPVPSGYRFIACLTHDVDFAGIRLHKLDHTMWGFLYRASVGSFVEFCRGICSIYRLIKNWIAVLSLPFVFMGLIKDPWDDFGRYAEIERGLSSTFFFIPFKNRAGRMVKSKRCARRATHYDINDVQAQTKRLIECGSEIGLHGIDAWHDSERGRQEIKRIVDVTGQKTIGVRMHWLCFDSNSFSVLEQLGIDYDSTFGYNETIGYKAGTMQAFRPLGLKRLLELPIHIQDTALFYPHRLALSAVKAWDLCRNALFMAIQFGGVITVLWHQRSLAPERLWDNFYIRLVEELKSLGAWFGTASQVVQWFRRRRAVRFEDCSIGENLVRLRIKCSVSAAGPPLILRIHNPGKEKYLQASDQYSYHDIVYSGESSVEVPLK
jgi:hypothetical protein